MRISRDKLVHLALATLAEQVELARTAPPPPSHGVRLALALLHEFGKGDRAPFDDFWREMTQPRGGPTPTIEAYTRTTYLQTQLRGVMRAVGIEPCVDTEIPLWNAALRVYPRPAKAPG